MSDEMLQKIFNKLSEMESKNDNQFAELNKQVADLNKKVDGITEQVVTNAEYISVVKDKQEKTTESHNEILSALNNLATKEDLEYLDKKVGEHDREIFKIKNRA